MSGDKAIVGYKEFIEICQVDNPKYFGGYRVRADGLYARIPKADPTLSPEENAACVPWHPTGHYEKPALPLPCTLGTLRTFLSDAGLHCLVELPPSSGSGDDAVKAGAGATAKPEWVQPAWEMGTKWMLAEEKRTKRRPGIVAIAKYVEGEFKRLDIRSKRLNDYLDWQSIKKEITGITGRKPGDNFKNAMGNPQRKKRSPNVRAQ